MTVAAATKDQQRTRDAGPRRGEAVIVQLVVGAVAHAQRGAPVRPLDGLLHQAARLALLILPSHDCCFHRVVWLGPRPGATSASSSAGQGRNPGSSSSAALPHLRMQLRSCCGRQDSSTGHVTLQGLMVRHIPAFKPGKEAALGMATVPCRHGRRGSGRSRGRWRTGSSSWNPPGCSRCSRQWPQWHCAQLEGPWPERRCQQQQHVLLAGDMEACTDILYNMLR